MNLELIFKRFQELFESLESSQEKRVWKVANRINPHFILDDLLNPQDHPELLKSSEFNFEDGQLSGIRATRIAVNALIKDVAQEQATQRVRTKFLDKPKFDLFGWNISNVESSEVFKTIEAARVKYKREGQQPTLIFDLDGTLFDVSHRTLGIIHEWLDKDRDRFHMSILDRIRTTTLENVGYGLSHVFENIGLDLRDEEVVKVFVEAERYWRKRFFDGKALVEFDKPVAGAPAFVKKCIDAGYKIVYLSGRLDQTMRAGTEEQLLAFGFPLNEHCLIDLKDRSDLDDMDFKNHAFMRLCAKHWVLANFENEYVNLAAMAMHQRECVHVILDTQHSARPVAPLAVPVYRISHFNS